MGETRSRSSPRRIQVRPPSWVIHSSTVAGPLGPASSTAYWSLNRGLSTSSVLPAFEAPPPCVGDAAGGRAGAAGGLAIGEAPGPMPAPGGVAPKPPTGGGPGLAVRKRSVPAL